MAYYCKTQTLLELLQSNGLESATSDAIVTKDIVVTRLYLDYEKRYMLYIKLLHKTLPALVVLDLIDDKTILMDDTAVTYNANILTDILKEEVTLPFELLK